MQKLVVLIPAYNEEKTIGEVIRKIPSDILGIKTTVLVVNDCSRDATETEATKAGALVVSHHRNFGVGKTFQTGIEKALKLRADYLVNIDADGQYSPTDIEKVLAPVVTGEADFVTADRFTTLAGKLKRPENMPRSKYFGNILMAKLIGFLVSQKYPDVAAGFRAYSRKTLLLLNLNGKFTYTQETFLDLVSKDAVVKSIPIPVIYFKERKSKVAGSLLRYTYHTLKIIISTFRDYRPLLFFCYLAICPIIVSLILSIFLLQHFILTGSFTPYKYLGFTALYLFSSALVLLVLGFVADMFTRVRIMQEKILLMEKEKLYHEQSYEE